MFNKNFFLETERLILRRFNQKDLEDVYSYASDEEVTQYMTWDRFNDLNSLSNILNKTVNNERSFQLAITLKSNLKVIGCISIIEKSVNQAQIEFCLSKLYWNQNLMTEALTSYLEYIFTGEFELVTTFLSTSNKRASSVLQKIGFYYLKKTKKPFKGQDTELLNYVINKDAFNVFQLTRKIEKKLEVEILPRYHNFDALYSFIQYQEYILNKKIILIDEAKIIEVNDDNVFQYIVHTENYYEIYYFVNKKYSIFFDKLIKKEFENYQEYIIGFDNHQIERLLLNDLYFYNLKISFAESCTGGMMASTLINVSGASNVIDESFVTYNENAKINILGVNRKILKKFSVYSAETSEAMANGLQKLSNANILVSITGLAGGDDNPDNGLFFFTIIFRVGENSYSHIEKKKYFGTRNEIRRMQTRYIFWKIYNLINQKSKEINNNES